MRNPLFTTRAELEAFVAGKPQESQRLELKGGAVLMDNKGALPVTKAVSGLANADGGVVVFGIKADKSNRAESISAVLGESSRNKLEQLINLIRPDLPGVDILEIDVDGGLVFHVSVPASRGTPYQAFDHKYYRRRLTESSPMAHFEIEELRGRRHTLGPLPFVDLRQHGFSFQLVVGNRGNADALDVRMQIEPAIDWSGRTPPRCLEHPIRFLRPAQEFVYHYGTGPQVLGEAPTRPANPRCTLFFTDSQGVARSETFEFSLEDHLGAQMLRSEADELAKTVKDGLQSITTQLKQVERQIETLGGLAGPTGLDLSVSSRRSIVRAFGGEPVLERFPAWSDYSVLQEVLEIDEDLASRLEWFFRHEHKTGKRLQQVDGVTPALVERIRERLESVESFID